MIIYLYYGEYRNKREELLKKATDDKPLMYSISHTDGVWGCLVSETNVGFDIQIKRDADIIKIAKRFFLEQEARYVKEHGADGFYDIWTRKEACVKYFRTGLARDIKSFSTVKDGKLAERIELRDSLCYVNSFDLRDDIKCAYCSDMGGDDIWIKELK